MERLATVRREDADGVTVVVVSGEIDLSNGEEIENAILEAVAVGTRTLLLDLSGVSYFDSVGVRLLFDVQQRLARRRIDFCIVRSPASHVRKVLDLVGAERVLATYDDVGSAVGDASPGD